MRILILEYLKNQGKLKEAELSYRKAINLNPGLAEAHLNLGNILQNLGRLKEAESCTRRTIELYPTRRSLFKSWKYFT